MTEATAPERPVLPEAPYQISDKIGDIIFLVRGDNIQQTVEDYLVLNDVLRAAVPEKPTASQARATQVQRQVGGNTAVISDAENCRHGARVFKEGNGKKGYWAAWDCPSKVCDRKWVNE